MVCSRVPSLEGHFPDPFAEDPLSGTDLSDILGGMGGAFHGAWAAQVEGQFSDPFAKDPLGGLSPLRYPRRHGGIPGIYCIASVTQIRKAHLPIQYA
jgi:hypothetical protein